MMHAVIEQCKSIAESHRLGIGSSVAAAAVGFHRTRTKHDALAGILGLKPYQEPSEAMEIGTLSQPLLKTLYEKRAGFKGAVPGDAVVYRHPKYTWMIAHPDWIADDGKRGAEFKVSGLHTFREWGDPKTVQVPQEYYVQCLHQMIVCGIASWDLAVLMGTEFKVYPIRYDREQAVALVQAEKDFWERHVVAKEPLPEDGSEACRHLMTWLNPKNIRPLEWATGDDAATLNLYAEVLNNLKAEEGNEAQLANKIRGIIGDRDGIRTDRIVIEWKANKNGVRSFRPKLVAELEGVA